VVVCDLSKDGAADYVADATRDLDLGLVVSNAGMGHPGAFLKSDPRAERAIVQLNATTPMELARAFGRRLVSRGMGGLVFVSSAMAFHGAPYMASYAATKAFTLVFAESLHVELKPAGVDVLVVAPGATDTPARHLYPIDWAKLPIKWMTPAAVVDAALSSLGKRALVVPGMRNQFIASIGSGLFIRSKVAARKGELTRKAVPADWL
jgi:short-subunit dehydrogenase